MKKRNKKMKCRTLVFEVPESLSIEINKFLAKKAQGDTTQGMKKILLNSSIYSFMLNSGWKFPEKAEEEINEILNNARFSL